MSLHPVDDIIRDELLKRELVYTKIERIKIMAGTWNVGKEKAGYGSLISWLGGAVSDVGLVVVGLQEVEMGAGVLAMSCTEKYDACMDVIVSDHKPVRCKFNVEIVRVDKSKIKKYIVIK